MVTPGLAFVFNRVLSRSNAPQVNFLKKCKLMIGYSYYAARCILGVLQVTLEQRVMCLPET